MVTDANTRKLNLIGNYAFYKTSIESIIIPPHVIQIGVNAFGECRKLETIEFSENSELCLIKDSAFTNTAIESILIPQSVSFIGRSIFSNCSNLKLVEFSENSNLKYIDSKPFENTKIEFISIPEKFSGIRNGIFKNTPYLLDISIVSSRRIDDDDCYKTASNDCFILGISNQN